MAKKFNPGRFRHNITFLNPSKEKDSYGELSDKWTDFKTIKASKEPIIGNEFYTALTAKTEVKVKFRLRYTKGITDHMRIRYKNEVYEIISAIDIDSANKEMLCYCRAVD